MRIETIPAQEVAERMRAAGMNITPDVVRSGLEQRVYPFGDCITTKSGGKRYFIYVRLFEDWMKERDCG
jgi:hypothetical protein